MARNKTYQAIVLTVRDSGESNREAVFLTREEGILRATLFGGPKSKLRSHVSSFNRGTLWVYHDPVRDNRKVTDFDVETWRPGIREDYGRILAASFLVELVLQGHGGGANPEEVYLLLDESLETLAEAQRDQRRHLVLRFIWQYLDILGIFPDFSHCGSCACPIGHLDILWYLPGQNLLVCSTCRDRAAPSAGLAAIPLYPGFRRWFREVHKLRGPQALRYTLEDEVLARAIQVGEGLYTAFSGKGIQWHEE
ncbi:MAG TPA: DNA repair protein RecO [Termitinemataceae bacterium]|nr:DNA repair protein RecO [Termitinemataceae bacterium]HPP99921.1 DNA repair protein RecO [Termitinemataceae bacterium]